MLKPTTPTYATIDEAVEEQIVPMLQGSDDDYDMELIVDELIRAAEVDGKTVYFVDEDVDAESIIEEADLFN